MSGRCPEKGVKNIYRLTTERLLLETPTVEDAPTLFGLVGGEDRLEITAGLIWDGPDEVSDTLGFIEQAQSEPYDKHGFNWAIRDRTGQISGIAGTAMGMIGIRPRAEPGRGDVGYWLGKAYWGQDIMREALASILDLCFGDLDLVKVEADIFPTNPRSIRLVEGLGMSLEGTIRSAHFKRGEWVDIDVYGVLRKEWLDTKGSSRA